MADLKQLVINEINVSNNNIKNKCNSFSIAIAKTNASIKNK